MVDPERPGGEDGVEELAPPVEEAGGVAARGPVVEIELDLLKGQAGLERVDGHPNLRAEARGERETGGPRARADEPLPRERLAWRRAGAQAHELPAHTLRDPETAPDPASEGGDREIGVALGERAQRAAQVRVGQEQRPRRRGTLAGGQRLPLPQPLDPEHERPGRLRALGRPVAGAPVDDDHLGVGEVAAQGGHGLADALLLVPRRDEDRQALGRATHPRS